MFIRGPSSGYSTNDDGKSSLGKKKDKKCDDKEGDKKEEGKAGNGKTRNKRYSSHGLLVNNFLIYLEWFNFLKN